eukprot:jgi/Botrbrau1/808/Bobra.0352s0005.1
MYSYRFCPQGRGPFQTSYSGKILSKTLIPRYFLVIDSRARRVRRDYVKHCRADASDAPAGGTTDSPSTSTAQAPEGPNLDVNKEVTKFARGAATTFAPRASGAVKNPAYKGSLLYTIFEVQAWASLVVGGLLSFNLLFPSDKPDIARLIGMWSIWMFTVPSLRARDCSAPEKDALNILFLLIPVINVALPFVWKSFPFIYVADCAALAAVFAWKLGFPSLQSEPPAE